MAMMNNQKTLRDILEVLFRYLLPICIFTLATLAVSLIYTFCAKKAYVSKATVLNRLGTEQTPTTPSVFTQNNIYITKREQELKNEAEILTSDKVIVDVAKEILGEDAKDGDLLNDVREYLKSHMNVLALYDSDTLKLSFKYPDPCIAQAIMQIILNKYIEHHVEVYKGIKELNFMESKLESARINYETSLGHFSEFMNTHKIYDNDKQNYLLLERRSKLQQQLVDLDSEIVFHRGKLKRLQELQQAIPRYEIFNTTEVRNKQLDQLKSKLTEAEIEKQNLLMRYEPHSRLVKDMDAEINLIGDLITRTPTRVTDQTDKRSNEIYRTLETNILQMNYEIAGEDVQIATLREALEALDRQLAQYTDNLKRYDLLKTDLDLSRKTYERHYDGYLDISLKNLMGQFTNIAIIEQPSLDLTPNWPRRKLMFLLTAILVGAGNLALVILILFFENTYANPSEVTKSLEYPMVGVFPLVTVDSDQPQRLLRLSDFQKDIKEFQRIYTHLKSSSTPNSTVLFAESNTGEGATTIAFNLADFIATYHHEKVALVNYRTTELSSYAATSAATSQVETRSIRRYEIGKVDVFDCIGGAEAEVTNLEGEVELISRLRPDYRFIFINIPRLNEAPDLVFLVKYIDKVLLMVEAERTKAQVAKYIITLLNEYGFIDISIILNKRVFYIPDCIYRML